MNNSIIGNFNFLSKILTNYKIFDKKTPTISKQVTKINIHINRYDI